MQNTHKKIETLSNVAIIVVALILGITVVNRYFISAPAKPAMPVNREIAAGTKLPLSDVDWSKSDKNLVMVLSTTCHFCVESSPFYQQLTQQKAGRSDVRLITVMPQTVDEAQRYLNEHKITADEIRQANPADVFVKGTPTLIMVDQSGTVIESWAGKLPPDKEVEVLNRFLGEQRDGL